MQYLYRLIQVLLFIMCFSTIQAQCSWTIVGSGSASTATTTAYNDIAMSSMDVPYIIYTDAALNSAVSVKTFSAGAWQSVGSLSTYTNSAYTSIAMDGAIPYVAFSDGTNNKRAIVRKYTAGTWSTVGAAISTSTANNISLAVHNGTPYVAYVDVSNSYRATVKTFSAGVWTTLGTAVSTSSASYTSLSIDGTGTPYIIYQDVANSSYATVKRYNGTAWVAVGTGTVSTGAVSETYIDASYNNTPYIAYTNASNVCTIKTFTSGAWQSVGTGTIGSTYMHIALAVDPAGTPYLAYYELGGYKTSVSKYNGSAWVYAGNNYFSINIPNSHGLAITKGGTPYVSIGDASSGTYVKKLGSTSTITLQPSPISACPGSSVSMSVGTNTTGLNYQWQVSIGGVYANVVNGAVYGGVTTQTLSFLNPTGTLNGNTYRCIVNDGCTNLISNGVVLTVNGSPALGVNSATVCRGAAATLSVSLSGLTYAWSTGATTSSIIVTPTANTVYTVSGTNAFGCSTVRFATVTVNASKTLSGNVTSSSGAVSGNMILYKYKPVLSQWDSVAFTPFSSIYSFGTVDSSWYVVKAVPTSTSNVLVTYGTSAVSWKDATTITHGCTANSNHNVSIIPLASIGTGTGSLSGKISEGNGFGQRPNSPYSPLAPGQPIGGIVVKGGKNPGGSMFTQTTTGANGTYTLSGLPNNAPGESYFILVDIPGLDTNQTYHKIINVGSSQHTGLDFIVDSVMINPVPSNSTGIIEKNKDEQVFSIYPNPAKNSISIHYILSSEASVTIEVVDIIGKRIRNILTDTQQLSGNYTYTEEIPDIEAGIYFVKLKTDNKENTIKLLLTR